MTNRFWQDNPDAPFATLLSIIETHCHPEAWEGAYEQLHRRVSRADLPEAARFKHELQQAISDPALLPEDALFLAAQYDDGSDEAFLHRLWRDLYGDEPPPQKAHP